MIHILYPSTVDLIRMSMTKFVRKTYLVSDDVPKPECSHAHSKFVVALANKKDAENEIAIRKRKAEEQRELHESKTEMLADLDKKILIVKMDAKVAGDTAKAACVEAKQLLANKQNLKAQHAQANVDMALNASVEAADKLEVLEAKRRKICS